MKKYIYIILGVICLILIYFFVIDKSEYKYSPREMPSKGKTFVDVVNQNGIQYSFANPDGWLRLAGLESNQGTPLLYIYGGEEFETAKAIMFSNTTLYKNNVDNLEKFIKEDESYFKERGMIVRDLGVIKTENKWSKQTTTAYLRSAAYKTKNKENEIYSTIAYIDAGKAVVVILMQTKDDKLSESLFPIFEKTVKSYGQY